MRSMGPEPGPAGTEAPRVIRIFYDLKDLRARLAENSPVHYDICLDELDSSEGRWAQIYRIYGIDRRGNLIVHERRWLHTSDQADLRPLMADRFVTTVARPLNGLPGRLESCEARI